MTAESKLEKRIMQCVDDGLEVLGDSSKKAVYYYLENNFELKRKEIPKKPEIFRKGLISMFGEEGTDLIEKWIVEKLRTSFNLKQQFNTAFAEAVAMIKAQPKQLCQ
jgi:hypothetical protein